MHVGDIDVMIDVYIYIYRCACDIMHVGDWCAYFINPSKIHHKCTKVQHHKFIITSSTSLLRRRRLQVWPPGQRWRTGLRRRVDVISRRWHTSRIVWTRRRRLHKREEIACVRLKIENFGSTSPARGGSNLQETTAWRPTITTARRPTIPTARRPKITTARRPTIPTARTH